MTVILAVRYGVSISREDVRKNLKNIIHGCIDRFSRKVMWLVVSATNNDPLIVDNLFLNCIKQYKIVPKLLRMDAGTENIYCQDLQVYFTGEEESFLYASSTKKNTGVLVKIEKV